MRGEFFENYKRCISEHGIEAGEREYYSSPQLQIEDETKFGQAMLKKRREWNNLYGRAIQLMSEEAATNARGNAHHAVETLMTLAEYPPDYANCLLLVY